MTRKALVVDDSAATRFILSKMLKELGFESVQAAHGKEALTRLGDHGDCELALVDWNMPEMNGLEFIQALRTNHAYDNLKVVMVTTETEMMQVVRALEAGANEYIMKPFTKEMVADKMQILGVEHD